MSAYFVGVLTYLAINVLLAYSVYVPLTTGQFSLGSAGFMAIGAYVASVATVAGGLPLPLALTLGAVFPGVIGAVVSYPAVRLRGLYLAMATLAFAEIVRTVLLNDDAVGGALGYRGMQPLPVWLAWASVVGATLILVAVNHSGLGLAFRATRDDELVAELVGLDTVRIRMGAFGLGAAFAGLAGGLYAHYALFIEPNRFDVLLSIDAALMVVLGGSASVLGPLFGGVFYTLLPEALRGAVTWREAAFGVLTLAVLWARPNGLIPGRLPPWPRRTTSPRSDDVEDVAGESDVSWVGTDVSFDRGVSP